MPALPDRIESKIDRSGDCHEWQGHRLKNGYGTCSWPPASKGPVLVHNLVYYLETGEHDPRPGRGGATIDHACDNKACCNVEHMELVDHRENVNRGHYEQGRKPISMFRGVTYRVKGKPWMALGWFGGKTHYLGTYVTEVEAARAYDDFVADKTGRRPNREAGLL